MYSEEHVEAGPYRMFTRRYAPAASPAAPAVVLVHGAGGSGRYMKPLARELGKTHEVLIPELPGFGRSEKPHEVLGVRRLADSLVLWLDVLGLSRAAFLGNSFGCQVLADMASRHQSRVTCLILQGPTVDAERRGLLRQFPRWLLTAVYEPTSLAVVLLRDYLDCGLPRLFRTFIIAVTDEMEHKLPHVQAPALVVRGSRDPLVPQAWAEEVACLLPRGHLIIIPDSAHTINYSEPKKLARVTRAFLRSHRS